MEVVSYISGETVYSDSPKCACPVVTAFAVRTNDWMDDAERQALLPFVLRIAGSKSSLEVERKRAYLAADYAVRVFVPLWIELRDKESADRMRALAPLVDKASAKAAQAVCLEVKAKTYAVDAADRYAAAAAAAAADAYAYADAAAAAAAAAADAYAAAAAAADAAADAYAAAYADPCPYAAYAEKIRAALVAARLRLLDEMLLLTEPAEFVPERAVKLLELQAA
jgi:hypothetical protein